MVETQNHIHSLSPFLFLAFSILLLKGFKVLSIYFSDRRYLYKNYNY